ncbi:MAG TPA: LLM class flavin-dependent oxidoreductase [Burkholderiales bacterium]|nr:LLM class flavin-dependent oxidoreductase [Burkholderiales bacterium]
MSIRKSHLILGAFLPGSGRHVAAWRYPGARPDGVLNFPHYWRLAQKAERGRFDMIFVEDGVALHDCNREPDELSRSGHSQPVRFEPLTLLSALSVVTERIGLVATASPIHNEPYHVARQFASLDYLSEGRAGWNVLTSGHDVELKNINDRVHPEQATRYERTKEFMHVVSKLWDSWDDDAFPRDKKSGMYFNPKKLHPLEHNGKHFSVRGPLNVARSPQGHPVIVHTDSSDVGQELAAQYAEVLLTAQQTLAEAQTFYGATKEKAIQYGRSPDDIKIMPGIFPIIGESEQEAREKYEELQELVDSQSGLALLSELMGGVDLSTYPLDGPLPTLSEANAARSRLKLLTDLAGKENRTIRQLFMSLAGPRGHRMILGTPAQIADQMEDWFTNGGADGFNVMPPYLPGSLDEFVEQVVPILQQRGLVRTEYEGRTLREHLGLRRPINRFTRADEFTSA